MPDQSIQAYFFTRPAARAAFTDSDSDLDSVTAGRECATVIVTLAANLPQFQWGT